MYTGPEVEAPRTSRQLEHEGGTVVSPTRRSPLQTRRYPGTNFCWRLNRPQGHGVAGRIKSMKNPTDPIGNRNLNFPACSAVPQSTTPPRTQFSTYEDFRYVYIGFFRQLYMYYFNTANTCIILSDPPIRYGILTEGTCCL